MKEGFLIGGGLIIAGLMLELSVGPDQLHRFLIRLAEGGLHLAFRP